MVQSGLALVVLLVCRHAQHTTAEHQHFTPHQPTNMKNALIATSASFLVVGVSCFAAFLHDTAISRKFTAKTLSGLALASMVIPAVGVLPLMAATELD